VGVATSLSVGKDEHHNRIFYCCPAEQAYKRVTQQEPNSDEKAGSKKKIEKKKDY